MLLKDLLFMLISKREKGGGFTEEKREKTIDLGTE
jgi:hypothetical protein